MKNGKNKTGLAAFGIVAVVALIGLVFLFSGVSNTGYALLPHKEKKSSVTTCGAGKIEADVVLLRFLKDRFPGVDCEKNKDLNVWCCPVPSFEVR